MDDQRTCERCGKPIDEAQPYLVFGTVDAPLLYRHEGCPPAATYQEFLARGETMLLKPSE